MRSATLALLAAAVPPVSVLAQAPAPAPPKNLASNGSFETSFRRENLWDGVDATGLLTGERGAVPVLTASGVISEGSMPISVSVTDLNGDGLPDIAAMDVLGYFRVYFNEGTPQEPKFGLGELAGIYLTRIAPTDPLLGGARAPYARRAPRIYLGEITKSGKKDLLVGNYLGEILLLPNAGTIQRPDFRQPADVGRAAIPTSKDSNRRWGNVFAPAVWDWNKDGKDDLLLGEGSYSANNIHLLINVGTGSGPAFDENNRHVIAFGDGLEQLTPAVVDYNGDDLPDLLVAERSGKIAVYLNKGTPQKAGEPPPEIPFASFISGSTGSAPMAFGGISTVTTGDLNGDGLFDLVIGKNNGRIALALNSGTKTAPKFDAPVEIKGTPGTPPLAIPSGWDADFGLTRGNFYAYLTVVKAAEDANAQPADGQACLKVGYMPSPNTIMPAPATYPPALETLNLAKPRYTGTSEDLLVNGPARYFMLRQLGRFRLKVGSTYTFSFKVKGGRVADAQAIIGYTGNKKLSEAKVTEGERGSATVRKNEAREENFETFGFSPGVQWSEFKKDIRVSFKDANLKDLKETNTTLLQISFSLPPGGGDVYFDDVKVVEKVAP